MENIIYWNSIRSLKSAVVFQSLVTSIDPGAAVSVKSGQGVVAGNVQIAAVDDDDGQLWR
jgi:hypothetical protein